MNMKIVMGLLLLVDYTYTNHQIQGTEEEHGISGNCVNRSKEERETEQEY